MDSQTFKVQINLYDLSNGMAKAFSPMFLGKVIEGIWHTGLVVYGIEYYFGGGIVKGTPKQTPYGHPVQEIDMGTTEVTRDMFENFLEEIRPKYTMEKYDLLKNNCNNFTNECCEFLVGTPIPAHITGLPEEVMQTQLGQMFKPIIEQMQNQVINQSQAQPGSQAGGDQQQDLVRNIASLISQQQIPAQLGGSNLSSSNVNASQGSQVVKSEQETNVIPIDDISMFIGCTESSPKCVVDFYADWCGPCVNIKPLFNDLSTKPENQDIQFYKVNIDHAREVAQQLGVNSVPTFITYKDGSQVDRWNGANPETLKAKVQALKNA